MTRVRCVLAMASVIGGACVLAAGCGTHACDVEVTLRRDASTPPLLTLCADVARTAEERRTGLARRSGLAIDEALLIVMPRQLDDVCITNQEVGFAIDAAFINEAGSISAIERDIAAGAIEGGCHDEVAFIVETAAGVMHEVEVMDRMTVQGLD